MSALWENLDMKHTENILTVKNLYSFLESYESADNQENSERLAFLQFIKAFGEFSYTRENLIGHITVSAWIVNPMRDKVLMAFHNLYQFWAWLGGHADNEQDLLKVIHKEIREESFLRDFKLLAPFPVDLGVLTVEKHYKHGAFVPAHLHYNLTYLFEADENQPLKAKLDENSGVKWLNLSEIDKYCAQDQAFAYYQRIIAKMQKIG